MEESLYPWKRIWRTLYRGNQNNEERVEFSPRPNPSRKILRQLIQHSSTVTGNGKCSHACVLPRELEKNRDNFFCIPAQKFSLFLQTAWLLSGMEDYKDVVPPFSRDKIGELEEAFASFRAAWGQSFPTQTQYTCWPKMGPFFTVVVAEGKASLSFISFLTQILELTETTNQSQSVFIEKGRYSSISLFCFHTTVRGICIVPFPTITNHY